MRRARERKASLVSEERRKRESREPSYIGFENPDQMPTSD